MHNGGPGGGRLLRKIWYYAVLHLSIAMGARSGAPELAQSHMLLRNLS